MKDLSVSKIISLVVLVLFVGGFIVLRVFDWTLGEGYITVHNERLHVLIASTPSQIYKGLGDRNSLDEYQGMVLDFGATGRHGIVMRDMKFPIDIVWVKKGVIVDIAKFIPVEQLADGAWTPYFPREAANAVLELPAGGADKYGLKIGDKIVVGE